MLLSHSETAAQLAHSHHQSLKVLWPQLATAAFLPLVAVFLIWSPTAAASFKDCVGAKAFSAYTASAMVLLLPTTSTWSSQDGKKALAPSLPPERKRSFYTRIRRDWDIKKLLLKLQRFPTFGVAAAFEKKDGMQAGQPQDCGLPPLENLRYDKRSNDTKRTLALSSSSWSNLYPNSTTTQLASISSLM
jgi:hypothetical protein